MKELWEPMFKAIHQLFSLISHSLAAWLLANPTVCTSHVAPGWELFWVTSRRLLVLTGSRQKGSVICMRYWEELGRKSPCSTCWGWEGRMWLSLGFGPKSSLIPGGVIWCSGKNPMWCPWYKYELLSESVATGRFLSRLCLQFPIYRPGMTLLHRPAGCAPILRNEMLLVGTFRVATGEPRAGFLSALQTAVA